MKPIQINVTITVQEGLNGPEARRRLIEMQEEATLKVLDRAGLIKLPPKS